MLERQADGTHVISFGCKFLERVVQSLELRVLHGERWQVLRVEACGDETRPTLQIKTEIVLPEREILPVLIQNQMSLFPPRGETGMYVRVHVHKFREVRYREGRAIEEGT